MTGQPDWQNDMRKAFAGLTEAFAQANARMEAHKRREGEDGYLAYDTAWECARVEYTWRRKHEAVRKGKEQWRGLYKVAIVNSRARHQDWEREKGLRLTAEGDRDMYKARCEESGRREANAWTVAAGTADRLDKARRDLEARRRALEAAQESAGRHRAKVERLRAALDDAIGARFTTTGEPAADTHDILVTPREGSAIRNVDRPGKAGGIGYISPFAAGWNAYVYQSIGPVEFVGWYDDADKAARAVDGEYGR